MEPTWDISMAVVSDLHCHELLPTQESWLIAGSRRKPAGNHPIQAVISLIESISLKADVLICPGDLANRVSSQGMMQSWDHLRELRDVIGAKLLLTTLGNHDVDCLKKHGGDPFDIPRNLHENFPALTEADRQSFWHDGFYFAKGPGDSEFLVLNTVIAHTDEASAKRGTFDHDRITRLSEALKKRGTARHRIAVMHHHPILHSSTRFNSSDVLEFGDQLLSLLSANNYDLVIHGHRHDPRITRQTAGMFDYFVFAAGSFSAVLKELSTWTRNLFHIVNLRRDKFSGRIEGEVRSWEYYKGSGWRPATSVSASLPHIASFSAPRPIIGIPEIIKRCDAAEGLLLRKNELESAFPELFLLLPSEIAAIENDLLKNGIKLTLNTDGTIDSIGRPKIKAK
jgi:predicted phosphodiesterase